MDIVRVAALALSVAVTGACASVAPPIGQVFRPPSDSVSILVMAPDVEVMFVTTGGGEVRADWSEQAESNLLAALLSELSASGERVALHDADVEGEAAQQALLLNRAVNDALASHVVQLEPAAFLGPLPHQSEQREIYTLGEIVRVLAPGADADYALFLTSRTQIESGGLAVANMLVSVVAGYTPESASFRGTYVSLVDWRTGEVVWLHGQNQGDPRDPTEAASIMAAIFDDGPLSESVR